VPYRAFRAADGDFIVAAGTDRHFARLCAIVGRPDWAEDPAFRTNAGRVENRETLERGLEEIFRKEPREHWIAACRRAGVPSGPARGPLEALTSATARDLHAVTSSGGVNFVASPIRVAGAPAPVRFPPKLDEQGDALRREFGLPAADR